jgi:hypothetical protein
MGTDFFDMINSSSPRELGGAQQSQRPGAEDSVAGCRADTAEMSLLI